MHFSFSDDGEKSAADTEEGAILVTGGAGFVGSQLCGELLEQGYEVYAVDNLVTGRRENLTAFLKQERFHFLELDINQPEFREVFTAIPLIQIYHLACPTGVPNITKLAMEMLLTCSLGTLQVMELARMHQARVLFTSTCEVYGQPEIFPQHEYYTGNVDPIGPRCPYEEGKRFSESLVVTYVKKYGVSASIVRVFNTYGPAMSPRDQRVIPRFLRSVCFGEQFTIYGDGQQTRTFLYVEDLLRGLLLVMRKGKSGEVYNIGSTTQVTIKQLSHLIMVMTNHKAGITFLPHFTEDHNRREPSIDKVRQLGWRQEISLEEGLRRLLALQPKIQVDKVTTIRQESKVAP